jgi:hypothetical protein
MKTKVLLALGGAIVLVAGCIGTAGGGHTAGVPFVRDSLENKYQRSPEAVFNAAKEAIRDSGGVLNKESIIYGTNQVKTITAKLDQRTVWIRIEPVEGTGADVVVQARTQGGGADLNLAHDLATQIALRLAR